MDLYSVDGSSTSCLYSQGCDDTEQTIDATQAQANWTSDPFTYPGVTTNASNIHATTN